VSAELTGTWVDDRTADFTDFYKGSFARIYRGVWVLVRDEDTAWDATQEAFERAYARWKRLRKESWAAGWVMTTALNVARKNGARNVRSEAATEASVDAPGDARIDISRALAALPARQQHALVLFYLGDLSIHDIAEVMKVSEGTVKAHLAQGRKALRETLGESHD
jgi:RNA polymerase sigma-70 factor, ECF subfamily